MGKAERMKPLHLTDPTEVRKHECLSGTIPTKLEYSPFPGVGTVPHDQRSEVSLPPKWGERRAIDCKVF